MPYDTLTRGVRCSLFRKVVTLGMSESDDNIGRAVLPLASIVADTEYDVWLPLHKISTLRDVGHRGHVHLRYSVTFTSERARLLSYPLTAASVVTEPFVLPFTDRGAMEAARFAISGDEADKSYNWNLLQSHVDELQAHLGWFIDSKEVVMGVIFWQWPYTFISLTICLWLQIVVNNPSWFLSCFPLVFVVALSHAYVSKKDKPPLLQQPTPATLLSALVLGREPRPLRVASIGDPNRPETPTTVGGKILNQVGNAGSTILDGASSTFGGSVQGMVSGITNVHHHAFNAVEGVVEATGNVIDSTVDRVHDVTEAAKERVEGACTFWSLKEEEIADEEKAVQLAALKEAIDDVEQEVNTAIVCALFGPAYDDEDGEALAAELIERALPESTNEAELEAERRKAVDQSRLQRGMKRVGNAIDKLTHVFTDIDVDKAVETVAVDSAVEAINPLAKYIRPPLHTSIGGTWPPPSPFGHMPFSPHPLRPRVQVPPPDPDAARPRSPVDTNHPSRRQLGRPSAQSLVPHRPRHLGAPLFRHRRVLAMGRDPTVRAPPARLRGERAAYVLCGAPLPREMGWGAGPRGGVRSGRSERQRGDLE